MIRVFLFIYFISHSFISIGQGGKITFNRKYHWINIASKLPYLSNEEKDRIKLTWGKDDDYEGEDFLLTFNTAGSVYSIIEKDENYGYSWGEEDDLLIRHFNNKTTSDVRILLGKKYLIEDDIPKYKWKILNELKDIAGYVCMKAETKDTVSNIVIHAWFTDKIPVMSGPEGFSGLPGMILALDFNTDDVNIIATKVELISDKPVDLPVPKKLKGKKILYSEYNARKMKHIKLSVEGRRNPYWEIRY
ncbi:MAG: GLPGLI family protein [Saprospiraceae bacterium]|nr:GLPGLI family protein [Saprospiraceae bacterium]